MSQPVGKRQLQFEKLELRALLAGNVLVSVVDGDLRVDGDDHGNVLELQQLAPSDPRSDSSGLSFRVTPDADTSINREDPGTGIVVTGVTRDIAAALRGGGDKVSFLGATGRQVRDLVIETGDGPDAVSITRFKVSGGISILAANSVDVSVARSTGSAIDVKVENTDRESEVGAEARASSVRIRNSNLHRSVTVSSDGPLAVDTRGVSIGFPDVCKVPAPPAPPVPIPFPCGNLDISSGAPLSADIHRTQAFDLFITTTDVERNAGDGAAASPSDVAIRNSNLHRVNVSSDGPLKLDTRGVSIGFPDVCKVPAPPAPFVPIPYPCGSLEVSSGTPLSADIHRTRAVDLLITTTDAGGRSLDGAAASPSDVTIRNSNLSRNVKVSSGGPLTVDTRGVSIGFPDVCKVPAPPAPPVPTPFPCGILDISSGAPLSADIRRTQAFDLFITTTDVERNSEDGAAASPSDVTIRNSNLRHRVNVSSDGPLKVDTRGVSIGFPDVCKVPAPPAPPVPIPYPCGSLEVSSGTPLSADIHRTQAFDLRITTTSIAGDPKHGSAASTSAVTIRKSTILRDVRLSSDAPLSVDIARTKVVGNVLIQAVGTPGSSALRGTVFTNMIRVVDSVFGSFEVLGSERRDEVSLLRLRVLGGSHIDLGGGNDSLAAVDSLFNGFAVLDGGADDDVLNLRGTRFRRGSQIVNWE